MDTIESSQPDKDIYIYIYTCRVFHNEVLWKLIPPSEWD